jgi:ferrous iron transport protein B
LSYWPGVSSGQYHEIRERARQTGQIIPSRLSLSYHNSYAAAIGQFIEPVFRPLGQNWKTSIALVTSLAGRTAIISTLVTLYGIENSPESGNTLVHALSADPDFSRPGGIAMMIFVLLCGSCLASIMMFFNETKSYLLTSLFIAYPIAVAWAAGAGAYSLLKILLK